MQRYTKHIYLLLMTFTLALGALSLQMLPMRAQAAVRPPTFNYVLRENALLGSPDWRITNPSPLDTTNHTLDQGIEGFASANSVGAGQSIGFAVSSTTSTFSANIYRMGWYQGDGARLMQSITNIHGKSYRIPTPNSQTGLVQTNWPVAFAVVIRANWVSGVYLVRLTNANGLQSYIPFVVTSPRKSDFVLIHSSNTEEAYNVWGGTSLYQDFTGTLAAGRAFKVSFDRPFYEFYGAGKFFYWEYPMIRWLEKSGYDVTYTADTDVNATAQVLMGHHGVLLAGHSEYWTSNMRAHLQAAINTGINFGAFAANSMYWQIRYEPSASHVANRIITCYKDASLDPLTGKNNAQVTVNFRSSPVNNPEQLLLGSMYDSILDEQNGNGFPWVVSNASSWLFARTGLHNGDSIPGIVGYEFDRVFNQYPLAYPMPTTITGADGVNGVEIMSTSPVTTSDQVQSYSNSTLYTAPSGARIFNAGTIQWSWGLDDFEFYGDVSPAIQQITANVLHNFITGAITPGKVLP